MVKRKRTLSTKENNESANQTSDADQSSDAAKRLKANGSPGGAVEGGRPAELASAPSENAIPSAAPSTVACSTEGSVSTNLTVPVGPSQSLSDVPLPQPSAIPQARSVPQLRTSARVLNKQRREETKVDNVQTNVVGARKSDVAGLESEFGDDEEALGTGSSKKRRRAWELWSMEDKDIFFESINECGKDFEAIQNYITTKLRKKGTPGFQIKNKDQVRHFYYRTWHKISKYITFHEGVKKATQELYGLINYGELRKKIGGTLDERKGQKLQELIRKGSTSVRVKGKSVRVRTPICRALKKLNQIEEHREHGELRVPLSITVEIVPASVHAWCHVQGQAHNPRVRVTTPLQRPLSGLISHLQEKWRRSDLKLRETLSSRATFPLNLDDVKEKILRILPPKGSVIKPISVQPDMLMKSSAVSLLSHEARLRRRGEKLGRSSKRKEKQPAGKGSTEEIVNDENVGEGDGPPGDTEGLGGDTEGTGCDIDGLGVDLEDLGGEVSQEELEDGSDVEVGCLNSPDGDQDEAVILSPDAPAGSTKNTGPVQVKEEPPDSPIMVSQDIIDSDIKVKEECEAESTEALRQLLALETVANAGTPENNADVVCIGESTRLTANVGEAQKGSSTAAANQAAQVRSNATSEEKGDDSSKQGEEEKEQKDDAATSAEISEAFRQKIQGGWILSTVGGITIGELYLLFGQNKKLNLEYDFEDPSSKKSCEPDAQQVISMEGNLPTGILRGSANCDTVRAAATESNSLPGAGMSAMLSLDREQRTDVAGKDPADARESADNKCKEEVGESKRAAVENLSGMLVQLLSMARVIMAKNPSDSCSCGHVCGRGGGGFRSPAASKGQGLLGLGRSPGSGRSPRGGRLTAGGAQSPMRSPGMHQVVAGRSPLASKTLKERNKPTSAKRLIPEVMDAGLAKADGRISVPGVDGTSSGSSNGVEVTFLPPISSTAIPPTVSTTNMISQDPGQMGGVRVVVGAGSEGGEFRVPVAPAPRQAHSQQASFNAQLNKFLPRYNNRPGRRVVRKNVVVQRQLPLLPKAVVPPPGVVTVKMLAPTPSDQTNSNFIPITIAPAPSGIPVSTGSIISANLQPKVSSSLPSPTQPITHQLLQPIQPSIINNIPPSPMQLPTMTTRLPTAVSPSAVGNAISVNISGQPLLTVEMPTSVSGAPVTVNNPSNSVSRFEDLPSISRVDNTLSSTVNTVTNASPMNGLLNTIVSQALSELPDLSTPPGTPQPSHMNKSPTTGSNINFSVLGSSLSSTITTVGSCPPRIPSPSLFNSSLSLDSLPSLSGGIMTNTPLVSNSSSASPSLSSNILTQSSSSSLSPITKLLTTASTSHLELSPPPSQTNSFASLLNTPTPHSTSNTPPIQVHNVSPTPPSLSALLNASSPPDMSRSFSSLLSPHHETSSVGTVPELHIPDGVVNLPLLDISLGGTVTLGDQTPNLLGDGVNVTLGGEMPSVSTITTVTSTSTRPTTSTSTMSGISSLQETSSDKLLDITLGISNSNSSFSSLLAAATQPRSLDTALLGTPSLVSDNCGIAPEHNGEGGNVVEGISGFPALSTTPPSPPSSPSRLLQQSDNQWLNNEVNDFSLSSLLGHFESPVKGSSSRGSAQPTSSGPMLPNLISVYNENSVDFTAKFAEMKAQASGVYKQ